MLQKKIGKGEVRAQRLLPSEPPRIGDFDGKRKKPLKKLSAGQKTEGQKEQFCTESFLRGFFTPAF